MKAIRNVLLAAVALIGALGVTCVSCVICMSPATIHQSDISIKQNRTTHDGYSLDAISKNSACIVDSLQRARRLQAPAAERVEFASILEDRYLNVGTMDTKVIACGINKRALRIEYVLMDRVLANELVNHSDLLVFAKELGFETIELTDGSGHNWTYRIQ